MNDTRRIDHAIDLLKQSLAATTVNGMTWDDVIAALTAGHDGLKFAETRLVLTSHLVHHDLRATVRYDLHEALREALALDMLAVAARWLSSAVLSEGAATEIAGDRQIAIATSLILTNSSAPACEHCSQPLDLTLAKGHLATCAWRANAGSTLHPLPLREVVAKARQSMMGTAGYLRHYVSPESRRLLAVPQPTIRVALARSFVVDSAAPGAEITGLGRVMIDVLDGETP